MKPLFSVSGRGSIGPWRFVNISFVLSQASIERSRCLEHVAFPRCPSTTSRPSMIRICAARMALHKPEEVALEEEFCRVVNLLP